MTTTVLQVNPIQVGYVGVFAVAAIACATGVIRARQIEDDDVRRGLVALLATSGGWAGSHAVQFAAPVSYQRFIYLGGLILGFSTVWAWLYFCSAYTGRTYHKQSAFRYAGAAIYLGIVLAKVTNPLHGMYFTTALTATPFAHLSIQQGLFHWVVTGLSYALATAGIFMLFERFADSGYDTRPLAVLVGLTILPVVLDVVGYASDMLIDVIYAPLGVALFTIGVLFVYDEEFLAVTVTGDVDDPVIFLDDEDQIQDYNPDAAALFPDLDGAKGEAIDDVLPWIAGVLDDEERIVDLSVDGERRHYFVTANAFAFAGADVGTVLSLSDVTHSERQRRELRRHNEQLEGFAGAITHELRNAIQVVDWNLKAADEALDEGNVETSQDAVTTAERKTGAIADKVDDFARLARQGQTLNEVGDVDIEATARQAWNRAETESMTITIDGAGTLKADPERVRELFVNAFEFARLNGADSVIVETAADRIAIAGDGEAPMDDTERYFAYDEAVPSADAGMKLPNVRTLARVHGWETRIDEAYTDGVRIVVSHDGDE